MVAIKLGMEVNIDKIIRSRLRQKTDIYGSFWITINQIKDIQSLCSYSVMAYDLYILKCVKLYTLSWIVKCGHKHYTQQL